VKEQCVVGVFASLDAIPLCLMDVSESFTIDNAVEGDEEINISNVLNFSYLATASGRQRIVDVISHATEKGYI